MIALVALFGILLLLQAASKSWRLAFVAFLSLPAALAGGVLAILITGGVVSLGSLFGFVAVLGLATRFSVLHMNRLQKLEQQENVPFGAELIVRGSTERLKPGLITVLAVAGLMLPTAVMGDIAGLEILRPLAFVVLGGLASTALLHLFILPALYLRFGGSYELDLEFDLAPVATGD
jgi:Cu/Ag efflux pump CusA